MKKITHGWCAISYLCLCIITFIFLLFSVKTNAAETTTSNAPTKIIKLGTSLDLSGVNKQVGEMAKSGLDVYFAKVNAAGGINGYTIELVALDDKYDPKLAGENTRNLIEKEKVLALIGNLGIANALTSMPIAINHHTLLFGPLAGTALSNPPPRYIFNVMTSYADHQKLLINYLIKAGFKPQDLAFFVQRSGSGTAIYQSSLDALKDVGYANPNVLPLGIYNPQTLNVEEALGQILSESKDKLPTLIISGGISSANQKFIQLSRSFLKNAIFITETSAIPTTSLTAAEDNRVIHSSAGPLPILMLPLAMEYRQDNGKYGNGIPPNDPGFFNYIAAKILTLAIQQVTAHTEPTRENIIDALESFQNLDIGIGKNIGFSKNDHQALTNIWAIIYRNGKYEPLDWSKLKGK